MIMQKDARLRLMRSVLRRWNSTEHNMTVPIGFAPPLDFREHRIAQQIRPAPKIGSCLRSLWW
jgi:hypothetical protein